MTLAVVCLQYVASGACAHVATMHVRRRCARVKPRRYARHPWCQTMDYWILSERMLLARHANQMHD